MIDQSSNPVVGVKIKAAVQHLEVAQTSLDKIVYLESASDSTGRLEIHGATGAGFGVEELEKTGYLPSPKTPNHFGSASGNRKNPVIIKMWKLGQSQQLILQDKDTRIPYDGTPITFDLLTGQKTVGNSAGDLRVTLVRNPLSIPVGYKQSFDWHATIEAIGGGVIQSDDDFMYEAPEEGYQPRIQIDMPAGTNKWANIYDISFYAKTRGGQVYSRVKLEFRVNSPKPQTGFTITSAANPNGSRNLQP